MTTGSTEAVSGTGSPAATDGSSSAERRESGARHWPHPLALAIAVVICAALPFLGLNLYLLTVLYYALFYAAFSQAWNVASGTTDYLSIAHAGLLGLGAYATVIAMDHGVPLIPAVAVSAVAGGVGGVVLGLLSAQVRGLVFAFTTLFLLESTGLITRLWESLTGGVYGMFATEYLSTEAAYLSMLALATVATLLVIFINQTRSGLELLSIRDDEDAALAVGINTPLLKFCAFVISGVLTGLIGGVHAVFLGSVRPESIFTLEMTLIPLALTLLGGATTVWGPIVAGVAYAVVREVMQVQAPGFHLVLLGVAIILAVHLRRGHLPSWLRRRKAVTP